MVENAGLIAVKVTKPLTGKMGGAVILLQYN
jgi:hypothetical protein